FFFIVSLFFAQLDYINMFVTIMCAVWLGAAGPIMVGGLYTRWGTTCGAWCALIFGSGTAMLGLVFQRNWANIIYPWLDRYGYVDNVGAALEIVSSPFHPFVVWTMNPIKFPINSMELFFLAMVLGISSYVAGSLLTCKEAYNLDRLFHRGIYSDDSIEVKPEPLWTWKNLYAKLIGITEEYTTGDKVIAWSVFGWSLIYGFGIMFCGVLVWNAVAPWPQQYWAMYFFISIVAAGLLVGVVSTVWFMVGGIIDMYALFRDLEARVANPLDNGVVEGHISLADKARFDRVENENIPQSQSK
ncbi:MAG: sodium:panthothenate symporter, partial [Victivallaceae bacterium]